ncbi:major capsid protein [Paraburkholderia sp. SIMBA_027]|uniref:major capsid protein n=1 Tax=Paraburkholderia sp. SIMBA_027 TaxID=3085770 RepID=UPI00397A20FD
MTILTTNNPTLADVAKRTAPDGSIDSQIVELLNQTNEVLLDAAFIEGNLATGHKSTVRTGLPQPTWRRLYGGVQPTKSTTVQVTDNCGMLEDYAEVDKALADLNGNTAAFRLSENVAHIEAINQEVASTLIYGNEGSAPAEFTGVAARYNDLGADNADNIIDAGGTGSDNTSIWLMVWGPQTAHMIYPKAGKAMLQSNDKGQVTVENSDGQGGRMEAYRTHYKWDVGFTLRDWRYVARIANIDVSDLATVANTSNLINWMIAASERIPAFGMGRAAWYVNRTVREKLRLGILNKISNNLTWETVAGQRVMMFDGLPVRRTDALLNTEARVVDQS